MGVIVVVVGLAAVEFFDKVTEKGYRPATVTGIVASVAAPLACYWVGESAIPLVMVLALTAGCATFIVSSGLESNPMPNMAITMLGITWIGLLGSFGALIVSLSNFSILTADGVSTDVGTDTLFVMALGRRGQRHRGAVHRFGRRTHAAATVDQPQQDGRGLPRRRRHDGAGDGRRRGERQEHHLELDRRPHHPRTRASP